MQNGFIERFNRSYREAVLDMYVFRTLEEVWEQTESWIREYEAAQAIRYSVQFSPRLDTGARPSELLVFKQTAADKLEYLLFARV